MLSAPSSCGLTPVCDINGRSPSLDAVYFCDSVCSAAAEQVRPCEAGGRALVGSGQGALGALFAGADTPVDPPGSPSGKEALIGAWRAYSRFSWLRCLLTSGAKSRLRCCHRRCCHRRLAARHGQLHGPEEAHIEGTRSFGFQHLPLMIGTATLASAADTDLIGKPYGDSGSSAPPA